MKTKESCNLGGIDSDVIIYWDVPNSTQLYTRTMTKNFHFKPGILGESKIIFGRLPIMFPGKSRVPNMKLLRSARGFATSNLNTSGHQKRHGSNGRKKNMALRLGCHLGAWNDFGAKPALKRSKRITTEGKALESERTKTNKKIEEQHTKTNLEKTLREARRQWQPNKNKKRDQKNTRESLRKEHEKNRKEHQTRAPEISPKTNTKNQEAPGATSDDKSKGKSFDSLSVGFALRLTQHDTPRHRKIS